MQIIMLENIAQKQLLLKGTVKNRYDFLFSVSVPERFFLCSKLSDDYIMFSNFDIFITDSFDFITFFQNNFKKDDITVVGSGLGSVALIIKKTHSIAQEILAVSRDISSVDELIEKFKIEELAELTIDCSLVMSLSNHRNIAKAIKMLNDETIEQHLSQGVFIIDPENTYIDPNVVIEPRVTIFPGTHITGNSTIATGSILGPNAKIEDSEIGQESTIGMNSNIFESKIGDDVWVMNSTILNSQIEKKSKVGPYAYIRPDSYIGENCKIGDFVEIKNSSLSKGTKVSHLSYIGDSDLGKDVNVGCGTVFVNYDGVNKHRSKVGDSAFIGCNSNIVSPVEIGKGAFIAAGSTITKNVEDEALGIARARQINKKPWSLKNKRKES